MTRLFNIHDLFDSETAMKYMKSKCHFYVICLIKLGFSDSHLSSLNKASEKSGQEKSVMVYRSSQAFLLDILLLIQHKYE